MNIKSYDCIPPTDDFEYLRLNGSITVSMDRRYNVPVFDLKFDGWYENSVRLWPSILDKLSVFYCLIILILMTILLMILVMILSTNTRFFIISYV